VKRFPAIRNISDQEWVENSVSEINWGKKKKVLELLTCTQYTWILPKDGFSPDTKE